MKFNCHPLWTLILLALIGFHSNALSQSPYYFMSESRAQEVLALKNKAPIDSQIVANLSLQNVHQEQNDSLSLQYASQALTLAQEHNRTTYLGITLSKKGNTFFYLTKYAEAKPLYEQSAIAWEKIGEMVDKAYSIMAIGKCNLLLGQLDSVFSYYQKALPLIKEYGDEKNLSSYLVNVANYYQTIGDLESYGRYIDTLIDSAERLKDPELLGKAYDHKGLQLFFAQDYPGAIRYLSLAQPYLDSLRFTNLLIENKTNLAYTYSLTGFIDTAIHINLSALELAREIKSPNNIAFLLGNISALYQKIRALDQAKTYREEALSYVAHIDVLIRAFLYTTLIETLVINKEVELFDQLMGLWRSTSEEMLATEEILLKYNQALGHYSFDRDISEAIRLLEEVKDSTALTNSLLLPHELDFYLAKCHLKNQNPQKALKYLEAAEEIIQGQPIFQAKSNVYLVGMEIANYQRRPAVTEKYRELYEKALQEDMDVRHTISLQMAETHYHTDKIRTQRDLEAQKAKNAQQRESQTLVITWLVGLGLIIVGGLSAFLYRSNQKQKNLTTEVSQQRDQTQTLLTQQKSLTAEVSHQRDRNQTLLNELNHRVKNNFQILSNLLVLQERQTEDPSAKHALKEGSQRMEAMAILHRHLYENEKDPKTQSGTDSLLNLRDYLTKLSESLVRAYQQPNQPIDLKLALTDLDIDVDQAISLGLIVNEWITNALKYAMEKEAYLQVSLRLNDPKSAELTVSDKGPGLPAGFDPKRTDSYGLQLVYMMANQIHGTVEVNQAKGTSWQLTFPIHTSQA